MAVLRLLGDACGSRRDAVGAWQRRAEACALDSGSKNYGRRGRKWARPTLKSADKLANEAETQTKEVISFPDLPCAHNGRRCWKRTPTGSRRTRGTWRRWLLMFVAPGRIFIVFSIFDPGVVCVPVLGLLDR